MVDPEAQRTEGTTPELAYPSVTDPSKWEYGRLKPGKPVWVRLDAICIRDPGTPVHTNGAGVIMTGEVPGALSHWIPTVDGDWLGIVDFGVQYANGLRGEWLQHQCVPAYALRPRTTD